MIRADIQGLRAFCILAVCIHHTFPTVLTGGFIGVDVFFVISGFLITRSLVTEIDETGRINVLRFWAKRAQRLLPNAFLTLLAVLMAAALLLPGYRLDAISGDLMSSAAFYSNIRFTARAIDYFESNDVISPVLHFWSLSLEEQFYFALPLILLGLGWLFPKRRFVAPLFVGLFAASFAFGLYLVESNSKAAFFLFPPRAWQLLAGGLAGIYFERIIPARPHVRTCLAIVGCCSIVASAVFYSDDLKYPGAWALLPTLGAAIALVCAQNTWIGSILSVSPFTWIGDRSYSIYLWHWPFLAISAELWPDSLAAKSAAIAGFIAASSLAFRVEDSVRHTKFDLSGASLRLGASVTGIILFSLLCQFVSHNTVHAEIAGRASQIQNASRDLGRNYSQHCHLWPDDIIQPSCVYGDVTGTKTVYLFGDSHAAMWFNPLTEAASKLGWKVVARTRSSCPSAIVPIWNPNLKSYYANCDAWRTAVIREINEARPDLIVVANYGNYYGWIYDRDLNRVLDHSESRSAWKHGVSNLVKALPSPSRIVVVRDIPIQTKSYRDCLSRSDNCRRHRDAAMSQMEPINPSLLDSRIKLMDFTDKICTKWCPVMKNGSIIYQDNLHLTATFTASFEPEFKRMLQVVGSQMSSLHH